MGKRNNNKQETRPNDVWLLKEEIEFTEPDGTTVRLRRPSFLDEWTVEQDEYVAEVLDAVGFNPESLDNATIVTMIYQLLARKKAADVLAVMYIPAEARRFEPERIPEVKAILERHFKRLTHGEIAQAVQGFFNSAASSPEGGSLLSSILTKAAGK